MSFDSKHPSTDLESLLDEYKNGTLSGGKICVIEYGLTSISDDDYEALIEAIDGNLPIIGINTSTGVHSIADSFRRYVTNASVTMIELSFTELNDNSPEGISKVNVSINGSNLNMFTTITPIADATYLWEYNLDYNNLKSYLGYIFPEVCEIAFKIGTTGTNILWVDNSNAGYPVYRTLVNCSIEPNGYLLTFMGKDNSRGDINGIGKPIPTSLFSVYFYMDSDSGDIYIDIKIHPLNIIQRTGYQLSLYPNDLVEVFTQDIYDDDPASGYENIYLTSFLRNPGDIAMINIHHNNNNIDPDIIVYDSDTGDTKTIKWPNDVSPIPLEYQETTSISLLLGVDPNDTTKTILYGSYINYKL